MRDQKPKYIVPDQVKDRVKAFMNDFMEANNLTKKGLAENLKVTANLALNVRFSYDWILGIKIFRIFVRTKSTKVQFETGEINRLPTGKTLIFCTFPPTISN